ncbi:MAG TPA: DUF692 family protein [Allosphingosinicella sp.]|nr:DUF692 family protein [Allosphingosinicella sp.]
MGLPDLGAGFVYLPGLASICASLGAVCDVVEVEPQTLWSRTNPGEPGGGGIRINEASLDSVLALGRPVLVHSVGFAIGGSCDGDRDQADALGETLRHLRPPWWSEHVSFLSAGEGGERRNVGFLMPPIQSLECVALVVDRIMRLQDRYGLPFAFETGVNYLKPQPGELPDGIFWGEIATRADCGILLDLHNLWANEVNGRQKLREAVASLPLERVWEIHVAGGQSHKGYWLDSHSGLPPAEVWHAARELVPSLPAVRAIILEVIPDYVTANAIDDEALIGALAKIGSIWRGRGTAAGAVTPRGGAAAVATGAVPAVADWERMVGGAAAWDDGAAPEALLNDGGIEIYRDLIGMGRRGMIVEALPLATRYLYLALEEEGLDALFGAFWRRCSYSPFASDEALNFAAFVGKHVELPHLGEVIGFELAAHRAALTGRPQTTWFSCDPEPLLLALKAGTRPGALPPLRVEVEVTPPN